MRKKNFPLSLGKYYFTVNSGLRPIMIHRGRKVDALHQYESYLKNGKECEWLGYWNGKMFEQTNPTQAIAQVSPSI